MSNRVTNPSRKSLLSSCAVAAIATLAWTPPAVAQLAPGGFQGTVNGTPIGATVTTPDGVTTQVNVTAPRAIVNWNASNNNFLPDGRTANFVGNSGAGSYVILNRVTPVSNAPIQLNGTVNSTINSAGANVRGGQVWFYSPSGILVGATGQFNVGSLLLSANNVTDNDFLDGNASYSFSRGDSNAAVVVEQGAQINAGIGSQGDNYVALIAPRVRQSGAVRVEGSAAYIGAEAVDVTISGSLFDISFSNVDSGTEATGETRDDAAVVHDGTTTFETGYGGATPGPRNGILVAVPKNDAVTMLVTGGFDYQVASGARVTQNKIILSAGYEVDSEVGYGNVQTNDFGIRGPGDGTANVRVGTLTATDNANSSAMSVFAQATGDATATADGGNVAIDGLLSLRAGEAGASGRATAGVYARNNGAVTAGSGIAIDVGLVDTSGDALNPHLAELVTASGGSVTTSSLRLDASATAATEGNASGGAVNISSAGDLQVNDLDIDVEARGGDGVDGEAGYGTVGTDGGAAVGGTVTMALSGTSQIGDLDILASGYGGNGGENAAGSPISGDGGNGTGGSVSISVSGGANVVSFVDVDANGLGGEGGGIFNVPDTTGVGGVGRGGSAQFAISGGSFQTFQLGLAADGSGGFGPTGGAGAGGAAGVSSAGGILTVSGDTRLSAQASGGFGDAAGGDATGGAASLSVSGGEVEVGYGAFLDTDAFGGSGIIAGDGQGGIVTLAVSGGGSATVGAFGSDARLEAGGTGAPGDEDGYGAGVSGSGRGGTINVSVSADSTLDLAGRTLIAEANGNVAEFSQARVAQSGGLGVGGTVAMNLAGTFSASTIDVGVAGSGGDGTSNFTGEGVDGSDGTGGTATLSIGGDVTLSSVFVDAAGSGGRGGSGQSAGGFGGTGTGGTGSVTFASGTISVSSVSIDATGFGGEGGSGAQGGGGGNGVGGTAAIAANGATVDVGFTNLSASGFGEFGAQSFDTDETATTGGIGGDGTGGTARIDAGVGGSLTLNSYAIDIVGRGGDGGGGSNSSLQLNGGLGGAGGNGIGGAIRIGTTGGAIALGAEGGDLAFQSAGRGGRGGRGGDGALGGEGPAGDSGAGGQGGDGRGGTVALTVAGGSISSTRDDGIAPAVLLSSLGFAGDGGSSGFSENPLPPPAEGGAAIGGSVLLSVADGAGVAGVGNFGATSLVSSGALSGEGGIELGGDLGGEARVSVGDGGDLRATSLDIRVLGDDGIATGFGPSGLTLANGTLNVTGNATIDTVGDVTIDASGAGRAIVGGAFNAEVDGLMSVNDLGGAGGVPTIQANSFEARVGNFTMSGGTNIVSANNLGIFTDTSILATNLNGRDIFLSGTDGAAPGSITVANAFASRDVEADAQGAISFGTVEAGRDILLDAGGDIAVTLATAGDDFEANSGAGAITVGTANTTGLGEDLDESGYGAGDGSNVRLTAAGPVRLDNGDVEDGIFLTSSAGPVNSAGLLTANTLSVSTPQDIALNDLDITSGISLATSGGSITGGDFESGSFVILDASGDVVLGTATASGFVDVRGASIDIGGIDAGGSIFLSGDGAVRLGSGIGRSFAAFGDNVSIGSVETFGTALGSEGGDGLSVFANGAADIGSATSATFIDIDAGSLTGGTLQAALNVNVTTNIGGIALTSATAGDNVTLDSAGNVTLASATAGDDIVVDATGTIGVGSATTTGLGEDDDDDGAPDGANVRLTAAGPVRLDNASVVDGIFLTSNTGSVNSAGLLTANALTVNSAADIALNDLDIENTISLATSGGSITGGDFLTGNGIALSASGNIDVASASAADFVNVDAGGLARVGAIDTDGNAFVRGGSIDLGTVDAGGGIFLSSAGAVRLDAGVGRTFSASGGTVSIGSVETFGTALSGEGGDGLSIFADGAADVESATSATFVAIEAASLTGGTLNAATDIDVTTTAGDVTLAAANAGDDVTVQAAGALAIASADANGSGDDQDEDGSNIRLAAAGPARLDTGTAADGIFLTSDTAAVNSAGTLTADSLSVNAATDIALNDIVIGNAVTLAAAGGSISGGSFSTSGALDLDAAGTITLDAANANGAASFTAGGVVDLGSVQAGSIAVNGASANLGSLTSGGNIVLAVTGDIALGTADATGDFLADAGGSFTGESVTTRNGGGQSSDGRRAGIRAAAVDPAGNGISIAAGGGITLANADSAGDVRLVATSGSIASSGTLAAAGALIASAGGNIGLANVQTGSAVDLSATGDVAVATDLRAGGPVDAAGRSVALNAIGSLAVRSARASGGDVALAAGGDLSVQEGDASGQFSANAGGTLGVTGTVGGAQIALASRDIAIGEAARLGTASRTGAVRITANGAETPIALGGSAGGSGYRLDNAEFGRIAAGDISFTANGAPLRIEALGVRGAQGSDPNVGGTLAIAGTGNVELVGAIDFATAGQGNALRLSAGATVYVDAASGSVSLANGGALAGTVDIQGRSILIAGRAAAGEVGNAGTIGARSDRLGRNDGAANNAGFIRGGTVRLAASDSIRVQNSGANSANPDDRAGITAGEGGITVIDLTPQTPLELILNARQITAGGTLTGAALLTRVPLQNAQGGASFAAGSTINGCVIGGASCGVVIEPPPPPRPEFSFAVQDVIEKVLDDEDDENAEDALTRPPSLAFTELVSVEGYPFAPVIDEPVTGTGNDDLYPAGASLPSDDEEEDDDDANGPVTGSGNDALVNEGQGNQNGVDTPVTGSGNDTRTPDEGIDAPVTGTGNDTMVNETPTP